MRSLKFPKMFNTNSTRVWKSNEHKQATMQNLLILLHSERGELFGDPYYGLLFKHYLYSNSSVVLEDALIDIIYNQIVIFMPQLKLDRNTITLTRDQEAGKLYVNFVATDQIDFTTDMYQLLMFNVENN